MTLDTDKDDVKNHKTGAILSLKKFNVDIKKLLEKENPQTQAEQPKKENKKERFENFLTQRKRLSRLAITQGIFFCEQLLSFNNQDFTLDETINEVYRVVIYFYKRMFFHNKYGDNAKNKKLEERFIRNVIKYYIVNAQEVDLLITKYLAKKWRLNRLNSVIRAGLRGAISEVLHAKKRQYKIIISEYTSLISTSIVLEKEVDFFNAILDNIMKEVQHKDAKHGN